MKQLESLIALGLATLIGCCGSAVEEESRQGVVSVLESLREEKSPLDFDMEDPEFVVAKKTLAVAEAMLVGEWRLAIEGGNKEFHKLPEYVGLMPFANPSVRRFQLTPKFPREHIYGRVAFWKLDEEGSLILEWSDMSGIRVTLQPVSNSLWKGTATRYWDFSFPGMEPEPVLEALLERVNRSG